MFPKGDGGPGRTEAKFSFQRLSFGKPALAPDVFPRRPEVFVKPKTGTNR